MSAPKPPKTPAPAPDATVRLKAGEPEDPYGTQRLTAAEVAQAGSTQRLPVMAVHPDSMESVSAGSPPRRIIREDLPSEAEGRATSSAPSSQAPRAIGWKLPVLLGSLVVLGLAAYFLLVRGQAPQAVVEAPRVAAPAAIPEAAALYLGKAQAGDAHAMRMLGVMYYYGLNVPQDRQKGLDWYRKAAANGSDAARDELKKLEAGQSLN